MLTAQNDADVVAQHDGCILDFCLFFLGWVHIHEWQTHIRLWHLQGELAVNPKADVVEVRGKDVHRLANVVAGGTQCPAVMTVCSLQLEVAYEFSHDDGGPPAVYGKAKAYPLPILGRTDTGRAISAGDVDEWFANGFADGLSGPACIAGA